MELSISAKDRDVLTTGIGVAAGLLAWENQATQEWIQYNPAGSYSILSKHRFEDAIASTFGNGIMKQIDPSYTGGATLYKLNPWGVVNKTSVVSGVVLVLDALTDDVDGYKKVSPYIEAAAWGGLIGGAIGGLVDPPPGNTDVPQTGQTNVQMLGPGSYQATVTVARPMATSGAAIKGWSN